MKFMASLEAFKGDFIMTYNINLDLQVKDINLSFQCLTLSYKKLVAHNNHTCVLSQMILKLQIRLTISLT